MEENAEAFVAARLQIINNRAAPAGDRLRATEQLESRGLGKPKETIEQALPEPEELTAMRQMTPEARRILLRQMNEAEAAAAADPVRPEGRTGARLRRRVRARAARRVNVIRNG